MPPRYRHRRRRLAAGTLVLVLAALIMVFRFHPVHSRAPQSAPLAQTDGKVATELDPLSIENGSAMSPAESAILAEVNRARATAGVKPLGFSAKLALVARQHSQSMAAQRYFAHDTPGGATFAQRMQTARIRYTLTGENIYMDTYPSISGLAQRVVQGWLSSPPHRKNMLSPDFTLTGIGAVRAGGTNYVTEDFDKEP